MVTKFRLSFTQGGGYYMNTKYSEHDKQYLIEKYLSGKSVQTLCSESGVPRSTLYNWIKKYQEAEKHIGKKEVSQRQITFLENKVKRLEGIIEIIKTADCLPSAPLQVKLMAIEQLYGQYSVHQLCEALEVARGTFYNHMLRNKRDNTWYAKRREKLRIKIQEIYDDSNQIFGAEKITAVLKSSGEQVSAEMIRELMHDMGLISIRQGAKALYEKENKKYKNYLNQQFHTDKPNQVWVSDVTCYRWKDKWYYICLIIDLFSRLVVGCKVGERNSTQLVKSTFKQAFGKRRPDSNLIFHTDRGGNYRSKTFRDYLNNRQVTQSFSKSHNPYDNSVMEAFNSSLKKEELYRRKYRSENEFRTAVDDYITFYNTRRPHASMQYKTPEQVEAEYVRKHGIF